MKLFLSHLFFTLKKEPLLYWMVICEYTHKIYAYKFNCKEFQISDFH